jgi:predicted nucleic acid-binding protein
MKKKVYIETSIISYLAAKPSKNLLSAAWQSVTNEWWENRRQMFDIYISELVKEESKRGDSNASQKRLESISGIPILNLNEDIINLAEKLIKQDAVPEKAADDALHIAISAVHYMDYLLTWNFRHIDNAETKPIVRSVCILNGYQCPEICTPQELLGEIYYEK